MTHTEESEDTQSENGTADKTFTQAENISPVQAVPNQHKEETTTRRTAVLIYRYVVKARQHAHSDVRNVEREGGV